VSPTKADLTSFNDLIINEDKILNFISSWCRT